MWHRYSLLAFLVCGAVAASFHRAVADEPLHARIDKLIEVKAGGAASPAVDDAGFLRRVTLDFAGRIPTAAELRAFLADGSADKRAGAIDRLLASEEYPKRMQELFHVMLMERLGEHAEWTKYLRESFAANKPWDQMTREMLSPDPASEATRGSAFFYSKRLENYGQNPVDYPALVRDVGRLFLGVDVQCAQCHDHLFIDDYKQADYQGLYAFLGTAVLRQDVKFPAVGENPLKQKIEFQSVFVPEKKSTGPRLPGGREIEIPVFAAGEEFATPPNKQKNVPGVLKFSPLKVLSEELPRVENAAFSRNAVNRLWWVMMGRGLVHPLDLHHSANPPSHPELLALLADEFVAHRFDIKWLLRELALTQTYQRSSVLPDGVDDLPPATYRAALERPLSTEQLLASMLTATGAGEGIPEAELTKLREKFAKAFANPPREPEVEHAPSVKAALFVLNDSVVLSWLKAGKGNLVERLVRIGNTDKLAEELYVNVLSRLPTDEERADVTEYVAKHAEQKEKAVGHLVWALMASNEFAMNH